MAVRCGGVLTAIMILGAECEGRSTLHPYG